MTDSSQPSRIALVTGGSRGIGRAIVEALLKTGWTVHFCSRSQSSVDEALDDLRPRFGDAVAGTALDVGDQQLVATWVATALEAHGRIDCLVNNAGLGTFAPVDELTADQWRQVLRTNLDGAFYCLHAVAGPMRRQGDGWIFNISSLAGRNPFAGGAAYNASKFGLLGLSDAAMLDLRQDGIRVSAILPGSVDTAFHHRDDTGWMMHPEDVAQAVIDLLQYPTRTLPSRIELRPTKPPK
ncbi:MAG: SDR family oxidoreductase [Acidobacteriota bacterium]|nr:SDR family oxidoreductase [Acidobacteriota bacterium]